MGALAKSRGRSGLGRHIFGAVILVAALLLTACDGDKATATPKPAPSGPTRGPAQGSAGGSSSAAAACKPSSDPAEKNLTRAQLPDCQAAYNQHDGDGLSHIVKDGLDLYEVGIVAFSVEVPEVVGVLTKVVTGTNEFSACAQREGIANWRLYTAKGDSSRVGVVAIASKNRIKDKSPGCVWEAIKSTLILRPFDLSPCARHYSYQANDDTYFVFYAGSVTAVCTDLETGLRHSS